MPEIARELGGGRTHPRHGAARGRRVRITVQLVHGPSDRHPGAGECERPLTECWLLESEIARAVASEVRATLTPFETLALQSHEHHRCRCLRRLPERTVCSGISGRATACFARSSITRRQSRLNPRLAVAHAAIAESCGPLGYLGFVSNLMRSTPAMRAAATRALEIDPDLVEGLTALGACAAFHEWRWVEGEELTSSARSAINPNYSTAFCGTAASVREHRPAEGERCREDARALKLDPFRSAGVGRAGLRPSFSTADLTKRSPAFKGLARARPELVLCASRPGAHRRRARPPRRSHCHVPSD